MKKQKLSRKLVLTKETISKLNDVEKNMVKGGGTVEVCGFTKTMLYIGPACGIPCHEQ